MVKMEGGDIEPPITVKTEPLTYEEADTQSDDYESDSAADTSGASTMFPSVAGLLTGKAEVRLGDTG